MYIVLDDDDCREIAQLICDCEDGNMHVYYSDYDICVYFYKELREHIEEDYFNGTGSYVTDDITLIIEKVELDDHSVKVEFCEERIERYVKEILGI